MADDRFNQDAWPALPWQEWESTANTLHMWTQIVGKTRLALSPLQAHWWNVPLYVTARGLGTTAMPFPGGVLEVEFDFLSHALLFRVSSGAGISVPLRPQTVAGFYREYRSCLSQLGISLKIYPVPVEVKDPIPFDEDTQHASYDPEYARRFWRILMRSTYLFQQFSSRFLGKVSPAHFFWGSFDLAVSRFSGRRAPERKGADAITQEAYSHEVISAGFWPGNGGFGEAAFYCYAAPAPAGLEALKIRPEAAAFNAELGEFILKYDDLRREPDPDRALMDFLESAYSTAADAAHWDRAALERPSAPRSRSQLTASL
ncbi:MAG TPA: DUF5996 family protein [Acidobacteriaceae bacterium]|nr:DUF5996 family protein [Acidobacteriaceae bacterium]